MSTQSSTSGGSHGNGISQLASISADGRDVAFESLASNFAPGDTNGLMDIYARDRLGSTTQRVNVDSGAARRHDLRRTSECGRPRIPDNRTA